MLVARQATEHDRRQPHHRADRQIDATRDYDRRQGEREQPDLILMDIQLPDISGMEAARRLKEDDQTRTIPIIAVTAFAMSGDEAQILASGCDAYLAKPFSIVEFLNVVEHWTTNRA